MFRGLRRLVLSSIAIALMFIAIVIIYTPVQAWFYCGSYHGFGLVSDWQCRITDRWQDKLLLEHFNHKTQQFQLSIESSQKGVFIQHPYHTIKLNPQMNKNTIKFNHHSQNQLLVNNQVFLIKKIK